MKLIAWSEHFLTGIDSIDAQHKTLVDMLNEIAPRLSLAGDEKLRDLEQMLGNLEKYAESHFRFEEAMMSKGGIHADYLTHHKAEHAGFADEVAAMRRNAADNNMISGNDLLRFLASWLIFHILSEDKFMTQQLCEIAAGNSSDKAYLTKSESRGSAANVVLNNALMDLFSVLTQRNQELLTTNDDLRSAKIELALANEELEKRVQARTSELATATARLEREQESLIATIAQVEQAQGQLLQSEKLAAVGQLAAGVAHEINNPVGFVNSNLGSLASYIDRLFKVIEAYERTVQVLPADHPARMAMEAVCKSAELDYLRSDIPDLLRESGEGLSRVKDIINDLKDFSHVDNAEWQEADLNHGLESTLNVVWHEVKYKAEVKKDLGKLPLVSCIGSQINQVFMNLLINAAQAIDSSGSISIRTAAEEERVLVEIADTGVGMTPEVMKRIFEPFYTTKPVGKGTGLGLSISWEIIKRHHGTVEVDSLPGKGTTFRIYLPTKRTEIESVRRIA